MKQQMVKSLKIASVFLGGFVIGGVLVNLLNMYVRSTYRETIRIDLKAEQEFLAGQAARQGDNLRAVSHRWNVVDLEAQDGLRAFQKERNKDIDSSFFFPLYMAVLNSMVHTKDGEQEKVARVSEGIARGQLAIALESVGANEEAYKQWEIARALTYRKSIEEIRTLILKLREQEKTDTYLQAERAILGDRTIKTPQLDGGEPE